MVPAQPALEEPRPLSWMRDYGSRGALILHGMFQKAPVAKRPHLLELSMKGNPGGRNSMCKGHRRSTGSKPWGDGRECRHLT